MEQSLDPVLKKINIKLISLKDGKNTKLDSVKQSEINYISNSTQAILVAVNEAINEIDSLSNGYGNEVYQKPGIKDDGNNKTEEEDEDYVDVIQIKKGSKACKPSSIKALMKLQLTFNTKAYLSFAGYKITQTIVNSVRDSDTDLSQILITLLSEAYLNAQNNLRFARSAISTLLDNFLCPLPTKIQEKYLNIIIRFTDLVYKLDESRLAELTNEYKENLDVPDYCRAVTARQILILIQQVQFDISYFGLLLKYKIYTDPVPLEEGIKTLKKIIPVIEKLLGKCLG